MIYPIIFFVSVTSITMLWYRYLHRVFKKKNLDFDITNLDHDINITNAKLLINEAKTGFDIDVGPTGWPVGVNQLWEITLYEDDEFYYVRMIYHEYMLWMSFDDPYLLCKIPKKNLIGDLKSDYKYRYQVLWDITYTTLRYYEYEPYMQNVKIEKINGHTVKLGNEDYNYNKYLVISDGNYGW